MQEAFAVPVAIAMGLFMVSYLPWDPACDPAQTACVTAAEWIGLARFVGVWDEAAIGAALAEEGLDAGHGHMGGVRARSGEIAVRVFAHEEVPNGSDTVIYLAMEHELPMAEPAAEAMVRAQLRMIKPDSEARLEAISDRFVAQLGWRAASADQAVWSVAMERVSGSGELVGVEATT